MSRRRVQARDHAVFCPVCRRFYRALVGHRWAVRQARRLPGYPELVCTACLSAQALARASGLPVEECRNFEREPS